MDRNASTALASVLSATTGSADASPLLGTWKLQSFALTTGTGETSTPFGEHPTGYLSYSADGRMQVIGTADRRTVTRAPALSDQQQVALHLMRTMFAYAGTYSVEAGKVTHHVDVSWNEVWKGIDQVRFYEVNGDTLTITGRDIVPVIGAEGHYVILWERVKSGAAAAMAPGDFQEIAHDVG
jgi:Lipocalin-like domain